MRVAGRIVAECHQLISGDIKPGITTREIDTRVDSYLSEKNCIALFKGTPGPVPFPAATCISVNDEIVHGIPSDRVLEEGDVVSIDIGCKLNGWCGDSAWTYAVGDTIPTRLALLEAGEKTLMKGIHCLKDAQKWSEVALEMFKYASSKGFSMVVDFVGHGIGEEMHEDPEVPSYWLKGMKGDFNIVPGLVIAIEPMLNEFESDFYLEDDQWTVKTRDGGASVHFEHTVAVTTNGIEILTEL